MSITDILVYIDTSPACDARIELAANLARRFDAALTGIGLEEAAIVGEQFIKRLQQKGLQGDWRTAIGLAASFINRAACAADLVVVGQRDPDFTTGLDAPEDVVLGCGRPVLVAPSTADFEEIGDKVLIAWNGSREASRAVRDALPLLAMAKSVTLLMVNPEEEPDTALAEAVVGYLGRHGVNAVIKEARSEVSAVADVVLAEAAETGAGLLVMGAYGHTRLREMILGGATRDVLRDAALPVLMAR
jgi:nucleotide-binding universal stress UspA family protein